jgi:uracil phosphoribosyltransferase
MPVHILDHPLAAHILTHLRDKTTKPATFRTLAHQLSLLLAIEATSDVPTEDREIETPLEKVTGRVLAHQPLVVVPILRAGLGMVQPFVHATAIARSYYSKRPPLAGRRVFIVDPMLATGGSAVQALTEVKKHGAKNPTLVCIVSAPEGVAEVEKHHAGTVIHTAALDRTLNAQKYILPGLGDFGDRLYGT